MGEKLGKLLAMVAPFVGFWALVKFSALSGGAAISAALGSIGGPFGMLGGVMVFGVVVGLIARWTK